MGTSFYKSEFKPVMERYALALKIILSVTIVIFVVKAFVGHTSVDKVSSLLFAALLLVTFLYMLTVIPNAIVLGKNKVIIKRTFGEKHIPYSTIKAVKPYNEVQNDTRHFGSNGFLGYIGRMGSNQYGKYYSYVKNSSEQIFIITSNKNYLISCSDRELFIKELTKKIADG